MKKITFDSTKIQDPNIFGEFLREQFFTKKSDKWGRRLGCYDNFDLEPFFIIPQPTVRKHLIKTHQDFGLLPINEEDERSIQQVFVHKDNDKVFVIWFADGDITLIVSDGERTAANDDCKKSYGWKFL